MMLEKETNEVRVRFAPEYCLVAISRPLDG
jgi:hypothetical protein